MSFNFVHSDCPARETEWTFPAREIEWPCPDPVQLSPEKIEKEKQRAEKRTILVE